mgnify:CR=1 FL=1
MGAALVQAAAEAGIRLTLLDVCYLRGGLDGDGHHPLDPVLGLGLRRPSLACEDFFQGVEQRQHVRLSARFAHEADAPDPSP